MIETLSSSEKNALEQVNPEALKKALELLPATYAMDKGATKVLNPIAEKIEKDDTGLTGITVGLSMFIVGLPFGIVYSAALAFRAIKSKLRLKNYDRENLDANGAKKLLLEILCTSGGNDTTHTFKSVLLGLYFEMAQYNSPKDFKIRGAFFPLSLRVDNHAVSDPINTVNLAIDILNRNGVEADTGLSAQSSLVNDSFVAKGLSTASSRDVELDVLTSDTTRHPTLGE